MGFLDKLEEKIGHSPHPAVVDLPLGAWAVSAVSDIMGLATRQRAYDDTARISMGMAAFTRISGSTASLIGVASSWMKWLCGATWRTSSPAWSPRSNPTRSSWGAATPIN